MYAIGAKKTADPYYFAWRSFIELLCHSVELPPDQKIEFIFDRKKKYIGHALATFNDMKDGVWRGAWQLGGCSFEDSKDFPGLQAADILAYETHFEAENLFRPPGKPRRPQLTALLNGLVGHRFIDDEGMAGVIGWLESSKKFFDMRAEIAAPLFEGHIAEGTTEYGFGDVEIIECPVPTLDGSPPIAESL